MSKLEKLVLVREERERGIKPDVGKMLPHFQRCGFPLQKPAADYLEHVRHDGDVKITLKGDRHHGLPFGADILTLLWTFTTALDRNSRTIRFKAGADILREMDLPMAGSNYRAIMQSFRRIYGASYHFEWSEVIPGKGKSWRGRQGFLFDALHLWFHKDNAQFTLADESFENEIVLSEFAWNWLQNSPWLRTAEAYALRQSPGAIQLYLIIAARGPRLRGPRDLVDIPVTGPNGLDKQIGGATYAGAQFRWRQLLGKWLEEIKIMWPECPAELVDFSSGAPLLGMEKRGWYLRLGWFPQPSPRLPRRT
jgi:hypothetical protein